MAPDHIEVRSPQAGTKASEDADRVGTVGHMRLRVSEECSHAGRRGADFDSAVSESGDGQSSGQVEARG
jgi:hypothetical protein